MDINLFRQKPDEIRESQRRRFADIAVVDDVIRLDKEHREKRYELDRLRTDMNKINKEIGRLKISGLDTPEIMEEAEKQELEKKPKETEKQELEKNPEEAEKKIMEKKAEKQALVEAKAAEVKNVLAELNSKLASIGNLLDKTVPFGDDEKDNVVIRTWGEKRTDQASLKNHVDLVKLLGLADMERGADVAGGRGYYLKGFGVHLNHALIGFGRNFLASKGFELVQTPFFMRKEIMEKCAQLGQFDEELYKVTGEGDDKYLIATSEQPLCAFHMDEWIHKSEFPKIYAGFSTCFRKEAGSHGRDTLGIFRTHQFEKIEQFCMTSPDNNQSEKMLEELLENSEEFYKLLGLPYRVVAVVSGALNDAAAKKYDLEAWFPASGAFRELVSCSNCTDYQSRRLGIRYGQKMGKPKGDEKVKYAHLLNSTLTATDRTLCCILENYQTEDGVKMPEVLQPFLDGLEFLPFEKNGVPNKLELAFLPKNDEANELRNRLLEMDEKVKSLEERNAELEKKLQFLMQGQYIG